MFKNTKTTIASILAMILILSVGITACSATGDASTTSELPITSTTPETSPSEEPGLDGEEPEQGTDVTPSEENKPTSTPDATVKPTAKPTVKPTVKPTQTPPPAPSTAPSEKPVEPSKPADTGKATSSDIMKKVEEKYQIPNPQDLDEATLASLYGIDTSLIENFDVKVPLMNVKTNEIAIIKVKDIKDVDTIKKAMENRKAGIVKQFEQYLQDQKEIAEAAIIGSTGNYVYFVIDESASEIVKIIKANAK